MAKDRDRNQDERDRDEKKEKKAKKEKKHKAEKSRAMDASTPQRPRQTGKEDDETPLKKVQIDDRRRDHRQTDDQRHTRREDATLEPSEPARLLHRTANLEEDVGELRDETKFILDSMSRQRRPAAFLMQQVEAQQNKEAAKEIIISGWPSEKDGHTEEDRERIIQWMVTQAGTTKELQMTSHRTREDMLSYMSVITFRSKWAKDKFQSWWRKAFSSRFPPYYWDQSGQTWDKFILRQRMQIGNISRTKGIPLKVCMEALSSHSASPFYQNVSVLSIKWRDHAILHGPDTVIYIDYDEVEAIATIIITPTLFDIIEDHWGQAWDKVNYNVAKESADSASSQGKGSGKGKTTHWTRSKPYTLVDFPWELRLAKKKTASTTRSLPQKRRTEEEEEAEKMED